MCTEGIYAAVSDVSSSTVEAIVEGSEREMAIEKPDIVTKVPSICVGARPKPHELVWYDGCIQFDLFAAATKPRRFFWKPLHTAMMAIWDRFSMCVSLGILLYTFSYGSGTLGLEVVSSSGVSLWTSSSDSSIKMTFEHKNKG
jgi:hypothetical protein